MLPLPPIATAGVLPTTPVGTVVAFAGNVQAANASSSSSSSSPSSSSPSSSSSSSGGVGTAVDIESQGWMACDGRTLQQSQYNELFQVIGYLYGGQGGEFQLPDYRGYFLRGLAVNSQQDPGFKERTAVGQGTVDGVGSTQECMVQTHEHQYTDYPNTGPTSESGGGEATGLENTKNYTSGLFTDSSDATSLSGDETRPKNVYIYYIIKYTNRPNLFQLLVAPLDT